MTVTAYSPDARSCGDSADGLTATLHSVETNNYQLVAADPKLLPYGSMLTVPGYANNEIVPVLDCGGAIKGNRLDLLFPTHEEARRWGVKKVKVIVWQYVDGKPADNPRKLR
jgi:3D (Asp-Asp-Asp) domain-containing protein